MGKFDDILNQKIIFQNHFYQWIGFPENIFCMI